MLCFPNCKINLGLYVTERRSDGYHNLETVFYPVPADAVVNREQNYRPLSDILEIVPAAATKMHLSGLPVSGNTSDNLVLKAYHLLQNQYPDKITPLDIYLHKTIPMGAGLGGGSADGAYMLRLMNDHFQLGLPNDALAAMALQLGSDCPFFIYNSPQFAGGRGEQMSPLSLSLSEFSLQIICPQVHVSTGKAFGLLSPRHAPFDLRLLPALPITTWKDKISNDFENPVFTQHPGLAAIKEQLYVQGAIFASMSGSGSAIYGIFPKNSKATIVSEIPFEQFYIA